MSASLRTSYLSHLFLFSGKSYKVNEVGAILSQSEFSSTTTRDWLSRGTAHIQVNDKAEKMCMKNVALSIPTLLVFIFQVGNPSLLVEGRPAITFVLMMWKLFCDIRETLYLAFAVFSLLNKCTVVPDRAPLIRARLFWIHHIRTQNHFSWICFSVIYYRLFQTPAIWNPQPGSTVLCFWTFLRSRLTVMKELGSL